MKKRLSDIAPLFVCSLLVSSMAKMTFKTFLMEASSQSAFTWSLVFVFALYYILSNKKTAIIVFSTLILTGFLVYIRLDSDSQKVIYDFIIKSLSFLGGNGKMSNQYIKILGVIFVFLFSFIIIIPTLIVPFFPATFTICIVSILIQWEYQSISMLPEVCAILGALIVFFAHGMKIRLDKDTRRIRNISAAWIAPFAAIVMMIVASISQTNELNAKWEWLEVRTNIIGDYFSDMAGKVSPRTIFDLSHMGYLPLERLGGPVKLDDTEIMKVSSNNTNPLLLRGSMKNTYTGNSWIDTSESYRWRMTNKLVNSQNNIFNIDWPLQGYKPSAYFKDTEIFVYPSKAGSATVFSPIRTISVKPSKILTMLISFNSEGEIFSSRNIGQGISYTITAEQINYDKQGFLNYVVQIQSNFLKKEEVLDEFIELNYTKQFDSVPESVSGLAREITKGIESDYLKALAIKQYFEDGFQYTLNPSVPPEDRDFVEYFLETKTGYCTYYATAMAVMARSVGLPSRYVEGFKTEFIPRDKFYSVTGENAHAWAEIYIQGFGWLPFDPTVTSSTAAAIQSVSDFSDEDVYEEEEIIDYPDETFEQKESRKPLLYLIIFGIVGGIILSVIILLVIFKLMSSLFIVKRRSKNLNMAIVFYYQKIMTLFEYLDYPKPIGNTLLNYSEVMGQRIQLFEHSFEYIGNLVSKIIYGSKPLNEEDVVYVYGYYRELIAYIKRRFGPISYFIIFLKLLFKDLFHKKAQPF